MKAYIALCVSLGLFFGSATSSLQAQPGRHIDPAIKPEVQSILTGLSRNLDLFEYYQKKLEVSGRNQSSYDENKNIWISTILAVQAIASICENQLDLLTLYWDLSKSRQDKYANIRVRSLETSIGQITIMTEQLQINHRLLSPDLAEIDLYGQISKTTASTLAAFRASIALIKSNRPD
jgi:hypothetical protein